MTNLKLKMSLLLTFALIAPARAQKLDATFTINGFETREVSALSQYQANSANAQMEWKFSFATTQTGQPFNKFNQVHGKFMHLVIIKEDLSHFAHVHPTLDSRTGNFSIAINAHSFSPDNQDTDTAIPTPGKYYVIAEIYPDVGALTPKGELFMYEVEANGPGVLTKQVPRNQDSAGTMYNYFKADGTEGAFGDPYEVLFQLQVVEGCGGNLLRFVWSLREFESTTQKYNPIPSSEMKPWLQMTGHAVLMSLSGDKVTEKNFTHMHAMRDPLSQRITFSTFDRMRLGKNTLKIWGQFKHKDRILTLPFVFDYNPTYKTKCD